MTAPRPIAVIDYGAGNLRSVVRALSYVGATLDVTQDPDAVAAAPIVVLPGVGATRDTMENLDRLGMTEAISAVVARGAPFLGICVGMQVLCAESAEFGVHPCLGIVGGTVTRFAEAGQKVPQIGWNQVRYAERHAGHPLFDAIADASDFYFAHSYYTALTDAAIVGARTSYGLDFPSVLIADNVLGVQFHPEKSGKIGLRLLANFIAWAGH